MEVVKNRSELSEIINSQKLQGKKIGFVPTMEALHKGHLSLVAESIKQTDFSVASIFVNPTQFNDKEDLKKYPRTLEADLKMLEQANCDLVFAPDETEMYPEEDTRIFDFGSIARVMEGKHRPGHFNGVGQIVSKLFELVQPDIAFFGQKDFQQVAIIRKLVEIQNYPVKINACPIIREENGLAMSSRNERLSQEERKNASLIFKTLKKYSTLPGNYSVNELKEMLVNEININPYLNVEYFEVVDEKTLTSIKNWNDSKHIFGCIAVFCGNVRLIDNMRFNY